MTTQDQEETLIDKINEIVKEKTFSLDAVKAIEELRTLAKATQERLEDVEANNQTLRQQNDKGAAQYSKLERELFAATDKLANNAKLVEEGKAAITLAAIANAKAEAFHTAMRIVFAPNTIREQVMKSVPFAVPGQSYPSTATESGTIDRTEGKE